MGQDISLSAPGDIFALQILDKNKPDDEHFFLTLISRQSISNWRVVHKKLP